MGDTAGGGEGGRRDINESGHFDQSCHFGRLSTHLNGVTGRKLHSQSHRLQKYGYTFIPERRVVVLAWVATGHNDKSPNSFFPNCVYDQKQIKQIYFFSEQSFEYLRII